MRLTKLSESGEFYTEAQASKKTSIKTVENMPEQEGSLLGRLQGERACLLSACAREELLGLVTNKLLISLLINKTLIINQNLIKLLI